MAYIVFEGPDFSGKSTLTKTIAEKLGWRLVAEPFTENENAKRIKQAIINNEYNKETEIFMLAANRLDVFNSVITPERSKGVIADRSVISTMVYQETEYWTKLGIFDFMQKVLDAQCHNIFPDHIFYLEITHDTYLERLAISERVADEKEKYLMVKENWDKLIDSYRLALDWVSFRNPEIKIHYITPETTADEIISSVIAQLLPD